jgi:inosose dehydratase
VAGDIGETRDVLAEVTAAAVPLQVGFQRRFDAGYQTVRQAVRDGRLGRLHTLRACTSDPAPPPPQMAPGRVLAEMREAELAATEFGLDGFLPAGPDERAALLGGYDLTAVGGFVPVVLHEEDHDPLPEVRRALAGFGAARTLVLAAATGGDGYDGRPPMTTAGWRTLLANLDRVAASAGEAGLTTALHPHVGTMVETAGEVSRVLSGSGVPLCLDTGHLLVGGANPAAVARDHANRIAHVHLKDVDAAMAARVRAGAAAPALPTW